MIVRRCEKKDRETWVNLNTEFMINELGGNGFWLETKERGLKLLEESFDRALENYPAIILLLFEEDGKTIGFANLNMIYSVWSNGDALIVDDFYISEEYRGQGYGQEGLVLIEKYAMDNNVKRIQFHSGTEDEKILDVWDEYGYKPSDMRFYMRYL